MKRDDEMNKQTSKQATTDDQPNLHDCKERAFS